MVRDAKTKHNNTNKKQKAKQSKTNKQTIMQTNKRFIFIRFHSSNVFLKYITIFTIISHVNDMHAKQNGYGFHRKIMPNSVSNVIDL